MFDARIHANRITETAEVGMSNTMDAFYVYVEQLREIGKDHIEERFTDLEKEVK